MAAEHLRKNGMMAHLPAALGRRRHPDDPDPCNVYKGLRFPDHIYDNITEYHQQKAES